MLSSIYGIHDEAKDKEFELEMSWVCDESNRLHEKVTEMSRHRNIILKSFYLEHHVLLKL